MAITFDTAANQFPDNVSKATTATAIKTWLNTLTVTTVYELIICHVKGFYVAILVYA